MNAPLLNRCRRKVLEHAIALCLVRRTGHRLVRLGSEYGGWWVPEGLLCPGTKVLSAGVGEDTTFDEELLSRGCEVWALDPTRRAASHVSATGLEAGAFAHQFHFWPIGLWNRRERIRFYAPSDANHVSHSAVNLQNTDRWFMADCWRVADVMKRANLDELDLLKLDIEGAEVQVLDDLLSSTLRPRALCVEFDMPLPECRTLRLLRLLHASGYRLARTERWNFLFLHQPSALPVGPRS